jgi:hypothetical protein
MKGMALATVALALLPGTILVAQTTAPAPASTNAVARETVGRLLRRTFTDYTVMLFAPAGEPWRASWNDTAQTAILENPAERVVITAQYLKFPLDLTLREASGNRDAFLDNALRKYCAIELARSKDPAIISQPIQIQSRTLGSHYYRSCQVRGRDTKGARRGLFCLTLRGPADNPDYTGDTLVLTMGFPDSIPPDEEQRARQTFDIVLQNISFY